MKFRENGGVLVESSAIRTIGTGIVNGISYLNMCAKIRKFVPYIQRVGQSYCDEDPKYGKEPRGLFLRTKKFVCFCMWSYYASRSYLSSATPKAG